MKTQSHMVRDVLAAIGAVVALLVLASLLEGGALAAIVAMIALAVALLVFPLVVIHFDEREERLERRRVGARH